MINESKPKLTIKLKRGGQKIKHGGYSFLIKGELPENRKHVLRYLTAARENLIRDLGPGEDNLTAAQIIIIDRVVSKLGVVRCIEEHIRENSVMRGHDLAPSLKASYLAYNNSVRLDLRELGIAKRMEDRVLTPLEIAEEFDKKKGAKEKAKK
jgi:hypothetical protein